MQFAWVGCAPSSDNSQEKQESVKESDTEKIVNVYTHRHYDTDQQLFDQFEANTGIKVNVVKSSADELINRLEVEGASSQADVLVTADAGRLHRAKAKGLLQSVNTEIINESVPANLRDSDNQWIGLTQRARIIVYSKDRVDPKELDTYEGLTDPKWKGRILVRSSGNIYNQSLMAAMVHHLGLEGAKTWAEGVVANFARDPKGNDRDQV
ncbi:UNVERIFIED_CONTAM: hypothetical protein GTU68_016661 [Idotea baltica]|nr:hypothetical protein [Idotea baltica]